jgi:ABC-2 type transport system permease protein
MHALNIGIHNSLAMIDRSVRGALRQFDSLLMSIVLPVFMMLLFVYVFGGAIEIGIDYVNYVVPGVLVLCAGFRAASTAVSVATDMEKGVIDRFRSLPIASGSVLVGHVVASVLTNMVSTAIVIEVALAAGFRPNASVASWLLAGALLMLFILAISWVATALGLLVKNAEAANGATFFMLFLPYLSSGFVPTGTMPRPLEVVSEHQPYTPLIEAMRSLLLGQPVGNDAWLAATWFTAIGVAGMTLAIRRFAAQSR